MGNSRHDAPLITSMTDEPFSFRRLLIRHIHAHQHLESRFDNVAPMPSLPGGEAETSSAISQPCLASPPEVQIMAKSSAEAVAQQRSVVFARGSGRGRSRIRAPGSGDAELVSCMITSDAQVGLNMAVGYASLVRVSEELFDVVSQRDELRA